jgi:hypothetical protein
MPLPPIPQKKVELLMADALLAGDANG